MNQPHPEIIIVKRKGDGDAGHHGGAWKIAFADFMTAMMAFFLVLWIINATDKDTKTVVARYFNPVKLENPARATKGVHGMDTSQKIDTSETNGDQAPGSTPAPEAKDTKPSEGGAGNAAPTKDKKSKTVARPSSSVPVDVKATTSEFAIFSDPYMTIDRIAGGRAALSPILSPDGSAPDPTREAASTTVDSFRDPFKPIGTSAVDNPAAIAAQIRPPTEQGIDAAPGPANDSAVVATPPASAPPVVGTETSTPIPTKVQVQPPTPTQAPSPNPTQAQSPAPTQASPPTPTPSPTPTQKADTRPNEPRSAAAKMPPAAVEQRAAAAEKLSKELEQKLGALDKSPASPAIDVKATDEGLLISLTDRMTYSMFAVGSAEPRRELIDSMEVIARLLKSRPGMIVLRGYTDARPYKTQTYDNWRLSSARAQMAYYMLTRGGVPETRFDRVEGYADRKLRDTAHPLAAENRRIEILLKEPKA